MTRLAYYIAAAAVIVAVVACLMAGQYQRRAESSAIAADSARADAANLIRVREDSERVLRQRVAGLTDSNATLAGEVERLRKAFPKAQPTRVEQKVAFGTATGTARSGSEGAPLPPEGGTRGPSEPPSAALGCLLAPGDALSVRVTDLGYRTEAGVDLVVGSAEVWREAPPPRARLFAAPWDARLTTARTATTAVRVPRWSADATWWAGAGWSAGVDRRVAGPLWAGATGGVIDGVARGGVRVRVTWP